MSAWFLLLNDTRPSAENMATDEALLEAAVRSARPVLRLYGWLEPAATFGYFQRYTEVEKMTRLRPLIRRPTGGGLVPHEADWTYSVIIPPSDGWYSLRAVQSYHRMHEWIQAAFTHCGLTTTLSPGRQESGPGQCFAGAEQFDLLWQGRKIAGAAQRRTRQGLLIQGSIQSPPGVERTGWEAALIETATTRGGGSFQPWTMPPEVAGRAQELAGRKYSLAEYNRRR